MIYDPITRQQVEIVGRYPPQNTAHDQFVGKIKGEFRFARFLYGEQLAGTDGGFPVGYERDFDINSMVADGGLKEIQDAYNAAPELATV